MKPNTRVLAVSLAALATSAAFAQAPAYQQTPYADRGYQAEAAQDRAPYPQPVLDQILAPVALYPDDLLSQLLMAATYPRDVAEAARWSRANPGLQGEDAVRAAQNEPWDPSVKSLVAFPELLSMMGDRPDWVARLGAAFTTQQQDLMGTVQQLRRRADEAGNLQSNDRIAVERAGNDYLLAPANPETVYVPYYDPRVAYGSWWWPDYQPVYWNPWPGYGYFGIFGWGRGIALHSGFFYGGFDWGRRHVRYSGHRPYYFHGGHQGRDWRGGRDNRNDGRNWNNDRNDGRRYSGERAPQAQPRYERRDPSQQRAEAGTRGRGDNTVQHYNPSVRSVAPRYNIEGARVGGARQRVERAASVPNANPVQRAAPVQNAASVQRTAPQSNPAGRAAQNSQRVERASERRGGGESRGGEGREGRGRDR